MEGRIVKGIGGFYYVHTREGSIYSCRAAGIFRKIGIKPLVGDVVGFDITDPADMEGSINSIRERKNTLIRPAAANIDQALVVFAVREPDPSLSLLDRFLVYMCMQDIPVVIYFNKADLDNGLLSEKYRGIYTQAGYQVITGTTSDDAAVGSIRAVLKGRVTVLAGPSGVGKSTLTNRLCLRQCMEVGELSAKIRRGRQTTRHTELFMLDDESYVLDTPGFSSLYISGISCGELAGCFGEFAGYIPGCRFRGCSHVNEQSLYCAVKDAAERGLISRERYDNYCQIYRELRKC